MSKDEVSKSAKIRNRYNQVQHLTQDTNGKVTNSQLDTTNESQEVSPFLAKSSYNVSKICKERILSQIRLMPRLHLPRSSYDLFVYDFLYDFFGIIGSYKLRRMCYIAYDHLTISFGAQLEQNFTETLRISYDNRKVIVQSSCYLHDLPI